MRARLVILFFLYFNSLSSQTILSDTVLGFNCYQDGQISLVVNNIDSCNLIWYYQDTVLGSIPISNLDSFVNFSTNFDTLYTQKCRGYKVVVFDDNFFATDSMFFWVSCPLGIISSHNNIKCYGDSSGMLKRIAHSGSPPYFYQWYINDSIFASGNNDTLFSNLLSSEYKVVITDIIGCKDSISATISSPTKLNIDTSYSNEIFCRGTYTGTLNFEVSGGKKYNSNNKYYYYLISNQDTISYSDSTGYSNNFNHLSNSLGIEDWIVDSIMFDSLLATNYFLHVIDKNKCLTIDTFLLIEPEPYVTYASTSFPLICESDSGYLLIDSIIGGGNISYGFLGANSDSIYVPSGFYPIYIYDSTYFCMDTVLVRCAAQYEIHVDATIQHVECYGDSSGVININSISGGNLPYDVQWGGIDTVNLSGGSYTVLIVDAIGCVHEKVFIINQPDQFLANPIFYPPSCNGLSDGSITVNVTGGTGPISYTWINTSLNTDSIFSLDAGEYPIVVSDSISCIDTLFLILEDEEGLSLDFINYNDTLFCSNELTSVDMIINGGVGPYNIEWNDGNNNFQRLLYGGIYTCQVTDQNGCTYEDTLEIVSPDSLKISLEINYLPCDSAGSSVMLIINGGVEPFNILWSTGDTTSFIDSLFGINYWVLVSDSCGNTDSIEFNMPTYYLETSIYYDNVTHKGFVEIDSSSTLGPFRHEWTDLIGNIVSIYDSSGILCQQTYLIYTYDDSTSCVLIDTLYADYYLPNGIIDATTTSVFNDSLLWGASPYSYLWNTGEDSSKAFICPGSHWVEVTDIHGCTLKEEITIEPIFITLDPSDVIIECDIENLNIDLEADANGGTSPYSYKWSNGSEENPLSIAYNPGTHSVTVIDNNSCETDTNFVIASMSSECIPNIFSPNNDGINDSWNLEDTFLYPNSEVKIYGRFGKLLFESIGYKNPWNGKTMKGNDVPEGTYFYCIEIGNGYDSIKGTVVIVR